MGKDVKEVKEVKQGNMDEQDKRQDGSIGCFHPAFLWFSGPLREKLPLGFVFQLRTRVSRLATSFSVFILSILAIDVQLTTLGQTERRLTQSTRAPEKDRRRR